MIHAHRKHDMGTAHVVQMHGFHDMREVFTCDTPTCLNDSSVGHKEWTIERERSFVFRITSWNCGCIFSMTRHSPSKPSPVPWCTGRVGTVMARASSAAPLGQDGGHSLRQLLL